ncbi:MAG: 4-hydroxy-tetrahydrodipicolinate reductase [Acidimicrobiaceae bacterium]|nr:4-hydroxy-tetrahydrodipicolinate reductase [Acidimicrobiaceae bacterium]
MRVGVFGAGGQMGTAVCKAVADDPELSLVAAVDPRLSGIDLSQVAGINGTGLEISGSKDFLVAAKAQVAVDFTSAQSAFNNMMWCAKHNIHGVVGTTGLSADQLSQLEDAFEKSGANCIVAPNFAIGAILMMRFSEMASVFFDTVDIIELHHDRKVDAPSGTAMETARRVSKFRETSQQPFAADPTSSTVLEGVRGGRYEQGIHVHSLRVRGMVAHQEVIFGTLGQTLTIRHDSYDRTSFMPGVLLAVKSVESISGLVKGMDVLIDAKLGLDRIEDTSKGGVSK